MQRRKLRKYRIMQDFCKVTGVIGLAILITTSDALPTDAILVHGFSGLAIMWLSYTVHRFLKGYERYKILQEQKKSTSERNFKMYSLKNPTSLYRAADEK